jgi:hypothetical protein
MNPITNAFVSGLIVAGYLLASVFFLRFWTRTRDWLFLTFCAAFALFAAEQVFLVFTRETREEQTWFYLCRLFGFVLILAAIGLKNRRGARYR